MSSEQSIHILLLDGRIISLPWNNYFINDLISVIAAFLSICESDYFGVTYKDYRGKEHWLQNGKQLSDHEIRRTGEIIQLVFRIRFYCEHSRNLSYPSLYEQFFLQAKRLLHNGSLICGPDLHFQLIGMELYARLGPYRDYESAKDKLLHIQAFPKYFAKKQIPLETCVEQSLKEYRNVGNTIRSEGEAMIEFLETVETVPSYGVYYMEVTDKSGIPWWLGVSFKGIEQYDIQDKTIAKKIFPWSNVQNLYCRDKKFSIEFQEPKRIVHSRSDFNLYRDGYSTLKQDEVISALEDPSTQMSVSQRNSGCEEICVQVWYTSSPQHAINLFNEISAHFAHYKKNANKNVHVQNHNRNIFRQELSNWIRRGGSLTCHAKPDLLQSANQRMIIDLIDVVYESYGDEAMERQFGECDTLIESPTDKKQRLKELTEQKDGLSKLLEQKIERFRQLCQEEYDITGILPDDYIPKPGEQIVRQKRRIPTAFVLSPQIVNRPKSEQSPGRLPTREELEVSYALQKQIVQAKHKLLVEQTAPNKIRKQRKEDYNLSLEKLRSIERDLEFLRLNGNAPNIVITDQMDNGSRQQIIPRHHPTASDSLSFHSSGHIPGRSRQQLNSDSELRPPRPVPQLNKISSSSCHSLNRFSSGYSASRSPQMPQSPQSAHIYSHRSAGNQSDSSSQLRSPLSYQLRRRPPPFPPSSSTSSHSENQCTPPPLPARSRGHRQAPPHMSDRGKFIASNYLPYTGSSSTSSSSRDPQNHIPTPIRNSQKGNTATLGSHEMYHHKSPTRITYLDGDAFQPSSVPQYSPPVHNGPSQSWRHANSQSSHSQLRINPKSSASAVEEVAAACSATAKRSASESHLSAHAEFRYEPRNQLEESDHFGSKLQAPLNNNTSLYMKGSAHRNATYPSQKFGQTDSTESSCVYSSQTGQIASSQSSRPSDWSAAPPSLRMTMSCGDDSVLTADSSSNSFEKPYETSDYYKYSESLRRARYQQAARQQSADSGPYVMKTDSSPLFMVYSSDNKIPADVNYSDMRMSQSYTSAFSSEPY